MSEKVEIGLTADVEGVLNLSPSASWKVETTGSETELYEDNTGRVVFMSGTYFTKNPFPFGPKIKATDRQEKQDILRGGMDELPRVIEKGPTGEDVNLLWTYYPPESEVDRDTLSQGVFPLLSNSTAASVGSLGKTQHSMKIRQTTQSAALSSGEKQESVKSHTRKRASTGEEQDKGTTKKRKT
jgi:hypothetical protein